MTKQILYELNDFRKKGFWLAVRIQGKKLHVVSAAKKPREALQEAYNKGFDDIALMKSAQHYAAWTSSAAL